MGQPTECEHQDRASGATLQATTTGLAYCRHAANDTTVFTDGQSHVALTDRGLIGWDGPWIDSPLSLPLDGPLPTWCSWLSLGQQIVGYLCAYPNSAIGAWSPPLPGANAWLMLGILSSAAIASTSRQGLTGETKSGVWEIAQLLVPVTTDQDCASGSTAAAGSTGSIPSPGTVGR